MASDGCCDWFFSVRFLKWLVFILNLLFSLAGSGVLAFSIWLLQFNPVSVFLAESALADYSLFNILIAAGAVLLIVGVIGSIGAYRESKCLIGMSFAFCGIILGVEIGGFIWEHVNNNQSEMNSLVQKKVQDIVYRDYGQDEVLAQSFDFIQQSLECCGSDSFVSWANSSYNIGSDNETVRDYKVPSSCCVDPYSSVCQTVRKTARFSFNSSTSDTIVYTDGCVPKLHALIRGYFMNASYAAIGIGASALYTSIFTQMLFLSIHYNVRN